LKGSGPQDLERLSVILAARMLVVAGVCADEADAEARVRQAIASGAGVEKFRQIIEHQGGDPRVIDDYNRLPSAPDVEPVVAPATGHLSALQAEMVGRAAVALGAGRGRLDDVIDHGVGITVLVKPGATLTAGDRVFEVRHRNRRGLDAALALLRDAITVSDQAPTPKPLIVDRIL
jgi:thymidine phosphorylase